MSPTRITVPYRSGMTPPAGYTFGMSRIYRTGAGVDMIEFDRPANIIEVQQVAEATAEALAAVVISLTDWVSNQPRSEA